MDERALKRARNEVQFSSALLLFLSITFYCIALINHDGASGAIALALLPISLIALAMHAGHNAVHGAFAAGKGANDIGLLALDWVAVNGRLWQIRHLEHHKFPNRPGFDPDLDGGGLLDLGPSRQRPLVGFAQACLCFFAYGLVVLKLQIVDDLKFIGQGRVESRSLRGQRAGLALRSLLGKAVFITWALLLPLIVLPTRDALLGVTYCYLAMGLLLSLIFQVAHCNTLVRHGNTSTVSDSSFVEVQTCATANFRVKSKLISWYLAGLNLQIEHHIFPSLPSPLLQQKRESVQTFCDGKRGEYIEFVSYCDAFWNHLKFLYKGTKRVGP